MITDNNVLKVLGSENITHKEISLSKKLIQKCPYAFSSLINKLKIGSWIRLKVNHENNETSPGTVQKRISNADGRTNGRTVGRTYGLTIWRTDEHTKWHTDGLSDGLTNRRIYGLTNRRNDTQTDWLTNGKVQIPNLVSYCCVLFSIVFNVSYRNTCFTLSNVTTCNNSLGFRTFLLYCSRVLNSKQTSNKNFKKFESFLLRYLGNI